MEPSPAAVVRHLTPASDVVADPFEGDDTLLEADNHEDTVPLSNSSWFLGTDTWTVHYVDADHHNEASGACMTDFKCFTRTIRKWLHQWVRESHCPLIHKQLYVGSQLPPHMLDAFAAVALYDSKTDENEEVIMKIIEEKADRLLNLTMSYFGPDPSIRITEQLSHVQALFIYQALRLFDSNIRQRAQAEMQMPTLEKWNAKLWESANLDAWLQTASGFGGFFSLGMPGADATSGDHPGTEWRDWLLAESARRIWAIGNYMQSVYRMMRDNQPGCPGGVSLTARRGLWDAPSAAAWTRLVKNKDPLFMLCHKMDQLIPSVEASEIDELCLSVMTIIYGAPRLEIWAAKSNAQLHMLLK